MSNPEVTAKKRGRPRMTPLPEAAPPSSRIITAVRELSTKASSTTPPTPSPSRTPSAKAPPPTPKPPARNVPLAAFNAKVVSGLTTPLGARPSAQKGQQLPPNYKPMARKVTLAIVALPVAIVTSYVLWQRLVLGEERKLLVQAPVGPEEVKIVRGE